MMITICFGFEIDSKIKKYEESQELVTTLSQLLSFATYGNNWEMLINRRQGPCTNDSPQQPLNSCSSLISFSITLSVSIFLFS